MRFVLLVTLCFVASALAGYKRRARRGEDGSCLSEFENLSDKEFEELFEKLLMELGEEDKEVTRDGDAVTEEERKALLRQALKELKEVEDDDSKTYSLKINKFAIMTDRELDNLNGVKMDEEANKEFHRMRQVHQMNRHKKQKRTIPTKVNHCAATGPVENQGSCGSCWAFAASHALGGRMRLRDGGDTVYRLSEQQANDCSYPDRTVCKGGHSWIAWKHFHDKKISTDFQYPYNGLFNGYARCEDQTGRMNANLVPHSRSYVSFGEAPPANDINAIKAAVAEGPVVVYMNVTRQYGFSSIGSGVYDPPAECSQYSISHAMVICGYDNDAATGKDYWIVKNSWGTTWGDNGYIKVAMGKDACAAERHIYYPILDADKKTDVSAVCVNAKACSTNAECHTGACQSGACVCEGSSCVEDKICITDVECGNKAGACQKSTQRRFARQVADEYNKCRCGDSVAPTPTPAPKTTTTPEPQTTTTSDFGGYSDYGYGSTSYDSGYGSYGYGTTGYDSYYGSGNTGYGGYSSDDYSSGYGYGGYSSDDYSSGYGYGGYSTGDGYGGYGSDW